MTYSRKIRVCDEQTRNSKMWNSKIVNSKLANWSNLNFWKWLNWNFQTILIVRNKRCIVKNLTIDEIKIEIDIETTSNKLKEKKKKHFKKDESFHVSNVHILNIYITKYDLIEISNHILSKTKCQCDNEQLKLKNSNMFETCACFHWSLYFQNIIKCMKMLSKRVVIWMTETKKAKIISKMYRHWEKSTFDILEFEIQKNSKIHFSFYSQDCFCWIANFEAIILIQNNFDKTKKTCLCISHSFKLFQIFDFFNFKFKSWKRVDRY